MAEKIFLKILVEFGNLSNLANWIKNHCFLYGFFIDNGQKTYEKIKKNWIQMRPVIHVFPNYERLAG